MLHVPPCICGCACASQVALLTAGRGQEIVQETRLWDEGRQATTSMRTKEGLADYRCAAAGGTGNGMTVQQTVHVASARV